MNKSVYEIEAPADNDQVVSWLTEHLKEHAFLLAFADDGVIWGKMDGEALVTSNQIDAKVSPLMRGTTLQQAFIFDGKEEIRLFRDELNQWQVRKFTAVDGEVVIKESQILWGDRAYPVKDGFTHVFNARQQGLDHMVPLKVENSQIDPDEKGHQCIRLDVHHIVDYNENGEAYVKFSRLAGLRIGNKNEEVVK